MNRGCWDDFLVMSIALSAAAIGGGATPAQGPLRVHPENPRYFTDGTKRPNGSLHALYLTGSACSSWMRTGIWAIHLRSWGRSRAWSRAIAIIYRLQDYDRLHEKLPHKPVLNGDRVESDRRPARGGTDHRPLGRLERSVRTCHIRPVRSSCIRVTSIAWHSTHRTRVS